MSNGSVIVSIFALAVFAMAILVAWLAKDPTTLQILLGAAATNATTAVGYWLGSSAGSRAKDEIIARGNQP